MTFSFSSVGRGLRDEPVDDDLGSEDGSEHASRPSNPVSRHSGVQGSAGKRKTVVLRYVLLSVLPDD